MSDMLTEHPLFKPKPSKAESKAETTNRAAQAIIDKEAARREAKTARLREARLEMEAEAAKQDAAAKAKPARKPAARKTKTS